MSLLLQDTLVISPATVQKIEQEIEDLKGATDCADVVQSKADLNSYDTSKLTDNAIIKVLSDETHSNAQTYYRYSKDDDEFSFIGSIGPFYTKSESDAIEAQVRSDFADADTQLQNNIDTEASTRESADDTLQDNIDAEEQARINADDILQGNIENVANDLSAEVTRATGVEGQLRTDLTAETTRATTAEGTLTTNLNTEILNRQIADSDLNDKIDLETSDRESQDDFINGRIDGVINDLVATTGNIETHIANTSNPHQVTYLQVGALPNTTKYGANIALSIDSSTYVVTMQLKDQDGNNIGNERTIDLPLESVVVNGSYDASTKKVILTLQSGSTIEFSVADLIDGLQSEITSTNKLDADLVDDTSSTNKFVTTSEKNTWNNKSTITLRVWGGNE